MFGFLNPRPHSRLYRRAYARLCQHQRRHYGLWSLPFHSYEAVFLYQVALDAQAFPQATVPNVRCCRLACPTSLTTAPDHAVGRFCASVALLLGSIKLDDDIRDQHGLLARLARWVLRKRISKAERYFTTLDQRFRQNIAQLIADHHHLEQVGGTPSLDSYTEPTSLAFGYVFGLLAHIPSMSAHKETLVAVGRKLGAAIIAYDCAVDWRRDRRRGEFNPLADEAAVAEALAFAMERLAEAEVQLQRVFGSAAQAAATVRGVRTRLAHLNPLVETPTCPTPPRSVWARARQAARFVLVPVAAGTTPNPNDGHGAEAELPNDAPIGADRLPGGIENRGPAKKKNSNSCCDSDCGGCCLCSAQSCECGGEACAGADCCAGVECCACAA